MIEKEARLKPAPNDVQAIAELSQARGALKAAGQAKDRQWQNLIG